MRQQFIGATSLVIVLSGCQPATPAATFTPQDEADVRAIFDSVVMDVRAANWTAWGSRFSDDVVFHAPNAPALVGRDNLIAWAQAFPPVESFSFENVQVTGDGNLAYGTSAVLVKLKDLPPDTSKQLVVARRDSVGWRVVRVSLNTDLPLPAPPPPRARR